MATAKNKALASKLKEKPVAETKPSTLAGFSRIIAADGERRRATQQAYMKTLEETLPARVKALRTMPNAELVRVFDYAVRAYDMHSQIMLLHNAYREAVVTEVLRRMNGTPTKTTTAPTTSKSPLLTRLAAANTKRKKVK